MHDTLYSGSARFRWLKVIYKDVHKLGGCEGR